MEGGITGSRHLPEHEQHHDFARGRPGLQHGSITDSGFGRKMYGFGCGKPYLEHHSSAET